MAVSETLGCKVERGSDLPETIPPEGLILIAEGDDDIETILSPLSYAHNLAADVVMTIAAEDEARRDLTIDALLLGFAAAITADHTLGGAVEWCEIGAPSFDAFEGGGAAKSAHLMCTLSFTTIGSPLA